MRNLHWLGWWLTIVGLATGCDDDGGTVQQQNAAARCECPLEWDVDNIAICAGESTSKLPPLIYSTWLRGGEPYCGNAEGVFPQSTPAAPWSRQRISSTCTGRGTVCFALKQGDPKNPRTDDCVLTEQCVDFNYTTPNEPLELPTFDGWSVSDASCAYQYEAENGYLEFRVEGSNLGCEVDGEVVTRVATCPVACAIHPELEECDVCAREASEQLDARL